MCPLAPNLALSKKNSIVVGSSKTGGGGGAGIAKMCMICLPIFAHSWLFERLWTQAPNVLSGHV